MIDAAGRKVRIPTLLIAVLLPFQPLLSACGCGVHRAGSIIAPRLLPRRA